MGARGGFVEVLGLALRLGIGVSAGDAAHLLSTHLEWNGKMLKLVMPKKSAVPPGPALEKRFNAVGNALGASKTEIVT